jgi:rare lipoprotein A
MTKRFRTWSAVILFVALLLATVSCMQPLPPRTPRDRPVPPPRVEEEKKEKKEGKKQGKWYQEGVASYYGRKFHGRKTANGERYDMYGVSAAHKTLPFGTVVLVRNMKNGRELKVRINDRGPFVKGRIIDLSYGAAKKLGMVQDGIVAVKIRVVRSP